MTQQNESLIIQTMREMKEDFHRSHEQLRQSIQQLYDLNRAQARENEEAVLALRREFEGKLEAHNTAHGRYDDRLDEQDKHITKIQTVMDQQEKQTNFKLGVGAILVSGAYALYEIIKGLTANG